MESVARTYLPVETEKYLPKTRHSPIYSYDMLMRHHVDKWLDINFDVCIQERLIFSSLPVLSERGRSSAEGVPRPAQDISGPSPAPRCQTMSASCGHYWSLSRQTPLRYQQFIQKYCDTIPGFRPDERKVVGTKRGMAAEIKQLLAPIALRRTKAEVLPELPPLMVRALPVRRGKVKWSTTLMDEMKKQLARVEMELDGVTDSQEMFSILEGLAQSVSTLRRYLGLQKVEPAVSLAG
jgi:hypothetical protein